MVVTPNSRCILLKSPLKLDNYNQITFSNAGDQFNYFYNLPKIEHWNYTYVRKDGIIRVETNDDLTFEDLLEYNYCMYQNTHYDNKWFYAFVTDVTYSNDGMTEIKIETDPFQSWQFDLIYKNSFIEREHVSDDTIGAHTIPENLEHGPYIINSVQEITNGQSDLDYTWTCVGVTKLPQNSAFEYVNRVYGGVYSGASYFLFRTIDSAAKFIKAIDELGQDAGSSILCIFEIPITLSGVSGNSDAWHIGSLGNQTGIGFAVLPNVIYRTLIDTISVSRPSTINGYAPKNNKLFTSPYIGLKVSNHVGSEVEYHYEDFVNNSASFSLVGTISPGASMKIFPKNYLKSSTSKSGYDYGLQVAKLPLGSWNSDPYTNWLTQNGVNIMGHKIDAGTSKAMGGTMQAITGALTGNIGGALQGIENMFGSVQEMYHHSMDTPTVNGQLNGADITYAYGLKYPTIYKMSIKQEYARIIDNWFSMYGYKVNRTATPNIHKRSNWDYIKTIQVNIEGDVPEKDLDSIRSLFDNGCTFWHTTTNFLDYSKTNSIL